MKNIIIFSVSGQLEKCTWLELHIENVLQAQEVSGYYKGNFERSYILPLTDENSEAVEALALLSKQESILEVDDQGDAFLIYSDGSVQYVGIFQEVTAEESRQYDSYTRTKEGTFYTTIMPEEIGSDNQDAA